LNELTKILFDRDKTKPTILWGLGIISMYCAHRLFLSVAGSFFPHPGNVLEGGDRVFQPFQTMLASAQILEMGCGFLAPICCDLL
jgi:hypothetical protein